MKSRLLFLALAACLASSTQAVVLSSWNFETNTPADLTNSATSPSVTAEAGLFTTGYVASGTHAAVASDWTTPAGNGSANSFSSNEWTVGDYYQFASSSSGYKDITITFDQVSSSTGPRDFDILYSTNGTSFTSTGISYDVFQNSNLGTNAFSFGTWSSVTSNASYSYSFDLSGITALNDQSTIYLRFSLTSTANPSGGALASAGSSRMDNVVINGVAIPEPATTLLGAFGLLGLLRRRR